MKALLCAWLFLALGSACKEDKPATAEQKLAKQAANAAANESAERADGKPDRRPRPSLPDDHARERRIPDETPRDYSDPAVVAELEQRREERRKRMEAMLDTNKDGVVSPEERQARLRPMVERFDQNGDGKLTPEELASSNRRMAFDDPAAVDTDKNGEISLAELEVAVNARREQMRQRWRGRGGRGSAEGVGPD